MRNPLRLVGAAGLLSLLGLAPPAANLSLTPAEWRADLQVFATQLPARHINAFHAISRDAFERRVTELDARLEHLDGDEVFVGLEQLARSIGDGHTALHVPPELANAFPIKVQRFGDDYRVTDAAPGGEALLGARIVAIGGAPIGEVRERLMTVTPSDEGPGPRRACRPPDDARNFPPRPRRHALGGVRALCGRGRRWPPDHSRPDGAGAWGGAGVALRGRDHPAHAPAPGRGALVRRCRARRPLLRLSQLSRSEERR